MTLSSCFCSSSSGKGRQLGAAAKESGQYPEKHGKLPRPTGKELHLHFQVTEVRCIKSAPRVMEREKHVSERCHQLRHCIRVLQTAPQTPRLRSAPIQLELRGEGIQSVSLLLNQKKRNQI